MEFLETKVGFPDINDYVMHNHIDCHPSVSIMLWFHSHTPDLASIINVQVFLLGASMKGANVELNPFFPFVKSYSITEEIIQGGHKNLLHIIFEKGEISFLFEEVFHVRSIRYVGPVSDELKKGLAQK